MRVGMGGVNPKCLGLRLKKATPGSPPGRMSPIWGVRPAGGLLVWGHQGGRAVGWGLGPISSLPPCCISGNREQGAGPLLQHRGYS